MWLTSFRQVVFFLESGRKSQKSFQKPLNINSANPSNPPSASQASGPMGPGPWQQPRTCSLQLSSAQAACSGCDVLGSARLLAFFPVHWVLSTIPGARERGESMYEKGDVSTYERGKGGSQSLCKRQELQSGCPFVGGTRWPM